ncbi:MAG: sigma-70 family RNA polymerase sigma factor [Planctomycetes bacterium]|nr:sigma-70 family RNA polymerase sigma factor [Planctomycetota bacterium]
MGNGKARALFLRCARGDPEAWDGFRARYGPLLAYVARNRLARAGSVRQEDIEESVAQTYLLLLEADGARLRRYDPAYRPATWLGLIAAGAVVDLLRTRSRAVPPSARMDGPAPEDPADVTERRERQERLREALSRMGRRERLLARLVYEEGMSPGDAARVLGIRVGTAWSLLSRLRASLRDRIGED